MLKGPSVISVFPGNSNGRVGVKAWIVQDEETPMAILPAAHTSRMFWQLWMWTLVSTGPRTTVVSRHLSILTDLKENTNKILRWMSCSKKPVRLLL